MNDNDLKKWNDVYSDGMKDGYNQGWVDRKDKDIDELQYILLHNVNNHEKALSEIISWLNKQIDEKE